MILKLAMRNVFRHKARSIITLSTIIFGCIALIFVGGFFHNIFWQMRESYINAHTGHIQVYKEGFNKGGRREPFNYLIENYDEVKTLIKTFPEVNFVTGRIQFAGLISTGDTTMSFLAQGVEPQHERTLHMSEIKDLREFFRHRKDDAGLPIIIAGDGLAEDDKYGITLGQGLAESMDVQEDTPIILLANTVGGSTNAMDMNIRGLFFTSAKNFDDSFLRMTLPTAQRFLNTSSVQTVVVKLYKTEDTAKIKEVLQNTFKEKNLALELKTWEELADFYTKTVELFSKFYLIMAIIITAVVVLGIFNTMNMSVMERISEIGTMMALGVKKRGVLKLFLCEGIVLGVIGGMIGLIVGSCSVAIVSKVGIIMPPPPGATMVWLSRPDIVPEVLVSTFFLCVVIGGISSLYPAYRASRLVITEAIRYR